MGIDKTLAMDFFIAFSRFEYALIAARFFRERDNGSLEPDWNCFTGHLERNVGELGDVVAAGQGLMANTPKRLELVGGVPDFAPVVRAGQSDIRFIIQSLKRARNNLFHGGKYLTAPQPVGRNQTVIADCLRVLDELLKLPCAQQVSQAYDG
jgi:hypothetical protein